MWPTSPSLWQKLQSLLFPVRIYKGSSRCNPVLELFYFRGRYILATTDAVYSDGTKYRPLLRAFSTAEVRRHLPTVKKVLVLGTGLASAVHILEAEGFHPRYTLVEIDPVVLEMAQHYLPASAKPKVRPVEADAFVFVAEDAECYDMIIIDLFFGREVPDAAVDTSFLKSCKARLLPEGLLIMNYMLKPSEGKSRAKSSLEALFPRLQEISFGINKVYIASLS